MGDIQRYYDEKEKERVRLVKFAMKIEKVPDFIKVPKEYLGTDLVKVC